MLKRAPSLEAARDLHDMFKGAWTNHVRTQGGAYRLEVASAMIHMLEDFERIDPGFLGIVRNALNGKPLDAPSALAPDVAITPALERSRAAALADFVNNATWCAVGIVAATLSFALLLVAQVYL
jgi:hypothetical protein